MSKTEVIVSPEVQESTQELVRQLERVNLASLELMASTLVIEDDAAMDRANDALGRVALAEKLCEKHFGPKIKTAHKLHTMLLDEARPWRTRIAKLRKDFTDLMAKYEKGKRRAAAKLQDLLTDHADITRRETLEQANTLARQGRMAEAREVAATAENCIAPVVPSGATQLAGTTVREPWVLTATDVEAFVMAVGRGEIALFQEITTKGEIGMEPVLLLNWPVLRKKCAEKNGLDWPGIKCERDVRFAKRA